jgi:ubiquinone biosynthesis protein
VVTESKTTPDSADKGAFHPTASPSFVGFKAGPSLGQMLGLPSADKRKRYREIASALSRHGMGVFSNQLGFGWLLPFQRGILGHAKRKEPYSTGEHLRLVLEDLGTTAIKLGQVASTRPDLVPPEISVELEKLRDRVPPVATDAIVKIIEEELCCAADEVFEHFDPVPLAAASIGQVHAATLRDGTRVVVKVRKPDVAETVAADLAILGDLARRAAIADLLRGRYDFEALADEFSWTLRSELDYLREGRNADRLREILAGDPRVVVPSIHWRLTTSAVLVMERIDGKRISEVIADEGERARLGPDLARASADMLMKQVFEAHFFHADPHPGNLLVLDDGRLGLLDFGMVGQLDSQMSRALLQLLRAIVQQDSTTVADCLDRIGILRTPSDRDTVRREAQHLIEQYYGLSADQFTISDYLNDVMTVVRRHELQLPADLALVLKTVAMSEGLWRQLDPHFNAIRTAEPFVRSATMKMLSPEAIRDAVLHTGGDLVDLGAHLPGQLRRIATRLDRGELELALRHRDLDETIDKLSGMVSRLSTAIVAAALILGLPILATVHEPPGWRVIAPVMFFLGVTTATGLILRLIWAGRKKNRR